MDNKNTIESLSSNTSGLPAQKISINKKADIVTGKQIGRAHV